MHRALSALIVAVAGLPVCSGATVAPPHAAAVARYQAALRQGANWLLRQKQERNGSFADRIAPVGKTALAVLALLSSPDGQQLRTRPVVRRAVAYLVSMRQPDGSINTPGEKGLANYQTAAALSALCKHNDPAHAKVREAAKRYLLEIQRTDGTNAGGWGYNRQKRADLSNTQMTLDALRAAGLDEDSPAFKRCLAFLQRCQNRSESNDQPWAGNDGGGVYYPGTSKAGKVVLPNGKVILKSYGSMTYALLRGYVLCGLEPDDPRVQAAQRWLVENYALDENPGLNQQGLYYYYYSMASALSLPGAPRMQLPDGTVRPWAWDLAEKLVALQHADGHWANANMRWYENDPVLATSYAMLALERCCATLAEPR